MHKLIIGAPFGNYLHWPKTTRTFGTYTLHKRAGILTRFWRILSTVRYNYRTKSWINNLKLPNPGIYSLKYSNDSIISIHGFDNTEWNELIHQANLLNPLTIELNLSCPNVAKQTEIGFDIGNIPLIAKLPPIRWFDLGKPLFDLGIRHFHLCNSMPSLGGGISGKLLKQYSLWAIEEFREKWRNEITIIGGGGITDISDIKDYLKAGVDHVAVASMLLNPLNWRKIPKFIDFLESV